MEPKLLATDLTPVSWPANPELEWCPPGHGDLFVSLQTSGVLQAMLDRGYRWAFVSSSDNLAAVLDPRILAWMASEDAPFVMEVADRTPADRKGGHIARRRSDGGLLLREIAQTPEADLDAFQDTARHRYFNTNTIWFDLARDRAARSALPLIRNVKTVDPSDRSSPEVVQIETAMGAALGVVEGARALRVPRSRFTPVKTTNDLLALRSDAYEVRADGRVALVADRAGSPPDVVLDPRPLQARARTSSRASRRARRPCAPATAWSSAATSRSAPAWSCAATSRSRPTAAPSTWRTGPCWRARPAARAASFPGSADRRSRG